MPTTKRCASPYKVSWGHQQAETRKEWSGDNLTRSDDTQNRCRLILHGQWRRWKQEQVKDARKPQSWCSSEDSAQECDGENRSERQICIIAYAKRRLSSHPSENASQEHCTALHEGGQAERDTVSSETLSSCLLPCGEGTWKMMRRTLWCGLLYVKTKRRR